MFQSEIPPMITAPKRLTIVRFQELGKSARRGQCLSDQRLSDQRLSDQRLSDQRHFDFQAWAKPQHQPRLGLIERRESIQDEQHRRR